MGVEDKVVIEVALNENQLQSANANIPYTPEELAADARRCLDAGAAVVHYHARDPQTAAMSIDVELNLVCQRSITEVAPLVAYPTYGDLVPVGNGHYEVCSPASVRFRHFIAGVQSGIRFEVGPIDLGRVLRRQRHSGTRLCRRSGRDRGMGSESRTSDQQRLRSRMASSIL